MCSSDLLYLQIKGLKEELEAMHEAWLERDIRQRAQVGGSVGRCVRVSCYAPSICRLLWMEGLCMEFIVEPMQSLAMLSPVATRCLPVSQYRRMLSSFRTPLSRT